MSLISTIKPKSVHNIFYYFSGLLFLFLNKIRHSVCGYLTPRPFSVIKIDKTIDYDFSVVQNWQKYLEKYLKVNASFLEGKIVLELGPGPDLGAGIILLARGVKKYNAIDVNNLIKLTPPQFYERLFKRLEKVENKRVNINFLSSQIESTLVGRNDKLNYLCRKDFNLLIFKDEGINLIFSQAAFEHFDDVEKVISGLSQIVKPGSVLIAEVDLKTHTRWIRDCDPLNIYRYSCFLYNLFRFSGSPNRLRPFEYKEIFEKHGWTNIQIQPTKVLDEDYLSKVRGSLYKRFCDRINQMECLSVIICATKE